MPKTLNPQNAFPPNIPNFPISGNNEPIAIEPLENAVQAVLNRTENLHVRLSEAETQGVKRVRTVASLAALSAATGFVNGDVCDVGEYGRYRLYNPSSLPADGLWVLTASGGGRWVHTLRDMWGIGNGLATLDSSQRLAQDVRDASILTQHIANQAVTSAKLAPGSVVGHLGYTPLNRSGDTMTGALSLPKVNTTAGTSGSGNRHIELRTSGPRWAFGLGGNESGSNAGASFFLWRYDDAGNFIGEVFRAERNSGRVIVSEISGRYDHQNRFVVQSYLSNSVTIPANSSYLIAFTMILVPSGRAIYLRRVRYVFTTLLPRVQATNTWTGSANYDDVAVDTLLASSSSYVYLYIVNNTSNSVVVSSGHGIWAELEIR
ncbi:hypothetical protein [Meiothermus cerbereus]|uniref:hypothetical protein n=1 Tax=Meiothermus cerbereus TaxID=65552 RepID=UPI000B10D283|nr:hypothetical protein [Meiothermus cerbereus]